MAERPSDGDPRGGERPPRPPRVHVDVLHAAIVAAGVLALILVGLIVWQRLNPAPPTKFCAGVGLMGAPSASSPEAALAAWLGLTPGSGTAADWQRTDEFGAPTGTHVNFRPSMPRGGRYSVVTADMANGSWSIDAACV